MKLTTEEIEVGKVEGWMEDVFLEGFTEGPMVSLTLDGSMASNWEGRWVSLTWGALKGLWRVTWDALKDSLKVTCTLEEIRFPGSRVRRMSLTAMPQCGILPPRCNHMSYWPGRLSCHTGSKRRSMTRRDKRIAKQAAQISIMDMMSSHER